MKGAKKDQLLVASMGALMVGMMAVGMVSQMVAESGELKDRI